MSERRSATHALGSATRAEWLEASVPCELRVRRDGAVLEAHADAAAASWLAPHAAGLGTSEWAKGGAALPSSRSPMPYTPMLADVVAPWLVLPLRGLLERAFASARPLRGDLRPADSSETPVRVTVVAAGNEATIWLESAEPFAVRGEPLTAMLERTRDTVVVAEAPAFRLVYANRPAPAELGYDADAVRSLVAQDPMALFHPDDRPLVEERIAALMAAADGEVLALEARLRAASGEWRWYRHDLSVLARQPDGSPRLVHALIVDVTRERRLEAELRQAQKMEILGQLAGGIAHDFNNALTTITGYVSLLLEELGPSSRLREDIVEIGSAAERAACLTRQLLAFARQDPGRPGAVDVVATLERLTPMVRRLLGERIELAVELPQEAASVAIERGDVENVVLNLLLNARDAIAASGRVTLRVSRQTSADGRPWVTLSVTDTGMGIAEDVRAHLFEPFFTTKPVGRGTGLGLSSARRIVDAAGGTIEVASKIGVGTTFTVRLPAAREVTEPEVNPPSSRRTFGREHVLVVEDEPSVRRLIVEALRRDGYQVTAVQDGADALHALERGCVPAIVVTDVVLPRMTGLEVEQRIRERFPTVPVLFVSGYAESTTPELAGVPAARVLAKPFVPTTLLRCVRRALDAGECGGRVGPAGAASG